MKRCKLKGDLLLSPSESEMARRVLVHRLEWLVDGKDFGFCVLADKPEVDRLRHVIGLLHTDGCMLADDVRKTVVTEATHWVTRMRKHLGYSAARDRIDPALHETVTSTDVSDYATLKSIVSKGASRTLKRPGAMNI